jgi:hypothetical protein
LRRFIENVQWKRPELWHNHNWLHHNGPAHTSLKPTESLWLTTTRLLFPILPLVPWFCFVSQIENETEGTTSWNSVWHPKGIASGTQQL